jgi:FkbM family methyltransferase
MEMIKSIRLPFGDDMLHVCGADEDRSIMAMIGDSGHYEPHIQLLMSKMVKPGMVVADVGANYGQHTALLSMLTGPTGRVFAIEASDHNAQYLLQTLLANQCVANVDLINKGVWDDTGHMEFHHADNGAGWSFFTTVDYDEGNPDRKATSVPIDTLDNMLPDKVDFIKMDVEGSELRAIRGAKRILSHHPPLLIELNAITAKKFMGIDIKDVVQTIIDAGYRYAYLPIRVDKWRMRSAQSLMQGKIECVDALFLRNPGVRS